VTRPWLTDEGVDLRAFYRSPEGARALREGAAELGLPEDPDALAAAVEDLLARDGEGRP
jgi:hypothetical protein